ncbi:hypothetical protein LOTGIDRAFT_158258 [Lottia gigantea]|uniref:Uncharacterized protein n=1 Tax=Lottia gigantea TaxID=225164 RepID=V4AYA6_LOTGI|nr:hypothetical protein LOTGIDRAFT_158258 [Lottia gigantea]ESP00031.1 hypothetical protein LOTGIDRAFT_158258 [Lottia gigantea]
MAAIILKTTRTVNSSEMQPFYVAAIKYKIDCFHGCLSDIHLHLSSNSRQKGHEDRWVSTEYYGGKSVVCLLTQLMIILGGLTWEPFANACSFINLQLGSTRLFYRNQLIYQKAVNSFFQRHMNQIRQSLKEKDIVAAVDVRYDTPGFSANKATVVFLDTASRKIFHFDAGDSQEVDRHSPRLEKHLVSKGLQFILTTQLQVSEIVSDASTTIINLMASEFPQFIHSLDTWHKAKSIAKRLAETSKKAANKELIPWIRKIINHFWYCCHVSKGSVDRLTRRWFGILYHVTNVHSWVTDRCRHRENEIIDNPSRSWLNKSSTAYKNLRSIITDKYFLGNLKYYTRCRQTWCIENFYSHSLLKYCPKRIGFSFDGYVMRNQLAIIDYNHHTGRPALTNSQDEVCGMPQFSRKTKHWVAYERLVCKSYDYIPDLMSECMHHIYCARNEDYKKGKRSLELDDIAPNLSGESNPETTSNLLKEMKRRKSEGKQYFYSESENAEWYPEYSFDGNVALIAT